MTPIDRRRYPVDWEQRAYDAKVAAGWRCQKCGRRHMSSGRRDSCLTVHHPDRDPENPKARLEVLCAACHLKDEARARHEEGHKNQGKLFKEV